MTPTRADELRAAAGQLAPAIAERAAETEREGHVPDDLVEQLRQAGFFRMWLPHELGGDELDPGEFIEIVEALAGADGSTGWTVMIGAGTALLGGLLPEKGAREVYADPLVITGGALAPKGIASRVKGGWTVKGRWPFVSGSRQCEWLVGGCVVFEDRRPVRRPDGSPVFQSVVFPATDATIIDTWDVAGLCGTASNDVAVDGVFVPDHLALAPVPQPWVDGALYRLPLYNLLGISMAGVVLGIARAALDAATGLTASKVPVGGGGSKLADLPHAHEAVAKGEASLGAARAYMIEMAGRLLEEARHGGSPSLDARARARIAVSLSVDSAVRVVDAAYTLAGGSSLYRSSPLQRHFRDIHAATQHVLLAPPMWAAAGRVLLGADTAPGLL